MARSHSSSFPVAALAALLPRERVEAAAARLAVVVRQRKVDIFLLVWSLALGFQVGAQRTLDGLRYAYQRATGQKLARSSFHDRLSAKLAKLMHQLVTEAVGTLAVPAGTPTGVLAGFKDLLAIDSTVLRLHDWLSRNWTACRTNHTKAAAKLHMVMSVLDGSPRRVKLTPERTHDTTPWRRVERWVAGKLLLFDLGYYSYHLFDRIDAHGGFFLTRVKTNANPLIVAAHRRWRGQTISVEGRRLREVLDDLQRQFLDVEVQVDFDRRAYRGKKSRARRAFRLVAARNVETGAYHVYVTNVPADVLPAEEITRTYALRWQVELLFKAMKHHGHLDQLPSRKQSAVECLVWASVLAILASQVLYRLVRSMVAADRHMPPLRWASRFGCEAASILHSIAHPRDATTARDIMARLRREAPDPNRGRPDRALAFVQSPFHG